MLDINYVRAGGGGSGAPKGKDKAKANPSVARWEPDTVIGVYLDLNKCSRALVRGLCADIMLGARCASPSTANTRELCSQDLMPVSDVDPQLFSDGSPEVCGCGRSALGLFPAVAFAQGSSISINMGRKPFKFPPATPKEVEPTDDGKGPEH